MKKVHCCLVSDQPIPNMTTALQFRPQVVVLLYTKEIVKQKNRLDAVLTERGISVDAHEMQAYDMKNVITATETVLDRYRDHDITLNITGGTKIGTLGTFQAFYTAKLPILYVNTIGNEILKVSPEEETIPISVRIPIKEYLALYGFNVSSQNVSNAAIRDRREATHAMKNLSLKYPYVLGTLNHAIDSACPSGKTEKASYPLRIQINEKHLSGVSQVLLKHGLISGVELNTWIIPNCDAAFYLHGGWFEEYVYRCACRAGADEVLLNVKGQWDITGRKPPTNEFDVMIGKGNRLFFISCKTADPNRKEGPDGESISKEYLYELDSLGDRALGRSGARAVRKKDAGVGETHNG